MKKLFIVLLILSLWLSSCVDKRYIEELGIITVQGYDLLEDGQLQGTSVLFQFDPKSSNISQIIESKAHTSKGLKHKAGLKTSKEMLSGQIRLAMYGKDLAQKGIMRLVDTLARDASIANMLYITVSNTTANEVLHANNFEDQPNLGTYLHQLIKKGIRDEKIPQATLHHFLHTYYDSGTDPILPIISLKKSKAIIKQLAIFRDDTMVGQITMEKGFFVKLISNNFKTGTKELSIPKEPFQDVIKTERSHDELEQLYIDLDNINSKSDIELVDLEDLQFKVDIKVKARLLEMSENIKLQNPKNLQLLEEQVSKKVKLQLENLIKEFQEMNSDPFQFGLVYQKHVGHDNLGENDWRQLFPNIKVDFNVDIKILRHGIVT